MSDSITSLQNDLARAQRNANDWATKTANYDAAAAEMRQVATDLETEVGELHDLLLPIHRVHTSSTWEGNAATRSRERLDAHEGQLSSAIRMIDGVITDLGTQAGVESVRARNAQGQRDAYRRQERELQGDILKVRNS